MESQEAISRPESGTENKEQAREHAIMLAQLATDKKAMNVTLYDVGAACSYTDFVLIVSGNSDRHVVAIAQHLKELSKKEGLKPLGTEGFQDGHWALIDFGYVVVHVFYEPVRSYYELDRLWTGGEGSQIDLSGLVKGIEDTFVDDDDDDDDDDE